MTQQDLFSTLLPSVDEEGSCEKKDEPRGPAFNAASAKLPDGFYECLARNVVAHDLSPARVAYARELVRLQEGLSAFEQGALTLLVLATMIEQRRGSTRLPIHAIRSASGLGAPVDLQGDGGRPNALVGGSAARLVEIFSILITPEDGDTIGPETLAAEFLACLAGILDSGTVATLVGQPGDYRPLILDGDYLYQQRMLFFEESLLSTLRARLNLGDFDLGVQTVRDALKSTLATMPEVDGAAMQLNDEQKYAILSAVFRPFTVISGGPGTGKTSIVVSVLRVLARLGVDPADIALAAPTGKAAHRLGDAVLSHLQALPLQPDSVDDELFRALEGASTLHRLLGYSSARNDYYYHENNRLPYRVVIVDEASMIDLFLMERLLSAVEPSARFILLGDADQLPSVDAGAVFRDLVPMKIQMRSEWLALLDRQATPAPETAEVMARHAVRLERSYRMDPKSPAGGEILRAAKALNRGEAAGLFEGISAGIKVRETLAEVEGAGVEICEPSEDATKFDEHLINNFVEWWYGQRVANLEGFRALIHGDFAFEDDAFTPDAQIRLKTVFDHFAGFQALTITRVFATGSEKLNKALHARHLRFLGTGHVGGDIFATGEPVIMLKNDYTRGLFNGDQGVILNILRQDEEGRSIIQPMAVFLRDGEFVPFELSGLGKDIEHAFALTIHKSQGSEFDSVGIVLPAESLPLLSREILYTGMTRSRRSVLLVGARAQVEAAAKNAVRRFSGVADKLTED